MIPLLLFITAALITIAGILIINVLVFPRLRPATTPAEGPSVSILIPARDEAAVIAGTVRRLLAQHYSNFELIVLDDASSDGTAEAARTAGQGDARLRVMSGQPLPAGWSGKNWACHQLAQMAEGDVLLFTDADVRWEPDGLGGLIDLMQRSQADLLTVWPTQQTETAAERLTVPLIAMVIMGYLPVLMTHYSPFPSTAAANGQCMAWRVHAYEQLGGHKRVASSVLDDVTLARIAKGEGLRLRMADGTGLIQCRMYTDWDQVRDGFAKNILAGYGGLWALLAGTVFHLLVFILPWLGLFTDYAAWSAALIVMGILVRALSAAATRQRITDAVWLPVSVLLMTRIALQAIQWHFAGGPRWKGRTISRHITTAGEGAHG